MVNKQMLIWLIAIILIVGVIMVIMVNFQQKTEKGPIDLGEENLSFVDLPEQNIDEQKILGKWIGISEETKTGEIKNLENDSILFSSNGTYFSVVSGFGEEGNYKLEGDKVSFYDDEEELEGNSRVNFAYVRFDDNNLVLMFPLYPKIVVYEKVE